MSGSDRKLFFLLVAAVCVLLFFHEAKVRECSREERRELCLYEMTKGKEIKPELISWVELTRDWLLVRKGNNLVPRLTKEKTEILCKNYNLE